MINVTNDRARIPLFVPYLPHTEEYSMAVVEQKIEGQDAYVYVHDHDMKKTTTMVFNKQEEKYDNWKNLESARLRGSEESINEGEE